MAKIELVKELETLLLKLFEEFPKATVFKLEKNTWPGASLIGKMHAKYKYSRVYWHGGFDRDREIYELILSIYDPQTKIQWTTIGNFYCRLYFGKYKHAFHFFKDRKEFDKVLCARRDELDQKIKTMQDEHGQIEQVSSTLGMQYAREKGYIK